MTASDAPPQPLNAEALAEWRHYEAGNRRANTDYRERPSVVHLIIASLDAYGVGVTSQRFNIPPAVLALDFPDIVARGPGEGS